MYDVQCTYLSEFKKNVICRTGIYQVLTGINQVLTGINQVLTGICQVLSLTMHLWVPSHDSRFVCRYQRLNMHTSVGLSLNMKLTVDSCFDACIFVCT